MVLTPNDPGWYTYTGNPSDYPAGHRFAYWPAAQTPAGAKAIQDPYTPGGSGTKTTSEMQGSTRVEVTRDVYGNVVSVNRKETYATPPSQTNVASMRRLTPEEAIALGKQPVGQPAIGSQLYEKGQYLQRGTAQFATEAEFQRVSREVGQATPWGGTYRAQIVSPVHVAPAPSLAPIQRDSILSGKWEPIAKSQGMPVLNIKTQYEQAKDTFASYSNLKGALERTSQRGSLFTQFGVGVVEAGLDVGYLGYKTVKGVEAIATSPRAREQFKAKLPGVPMVAAMSIPNLITGSYKSIQEGQGSRLAGQFVGSGLMLGASGKVTKIPSTIKADVGLKNFMRSERAMASFTPTYERMPLPAPKPSRQVQTLTLERPIVLASIAHLQYPPPISAMPKTQVITATKAKVATKTQPMIFIVTQTLTQPKTAIQTQTKTLTKVQPLTAVRTQVQTQPKTQTMLQVMPQTRTATSTATATRTLTLTLPKTLTQTKTQPLVKTKTMTRALTKTRVQTQVLPALKMQRPKTTDALKISTMRKQESKRTFGKFPEIARVKSARSILTRRKRKTWAF